MHASNRTSERLLAVALVVCCSTDSVVEDEDFGCARAGERSIGVNNIRGEDLRVFQKLFSFRIILGLDLLVIEEVLLHAGMVVDLETSSVKSVRGFLATYVVDSDVQRYCRTFIGFRFANVCRSRPTSITRVLIVVQCRRNIMCRLSSRRLDLDD